ncbi:MAG: type II toxin-antitoxin system HicB family antitoxin [Lentihominibacter sp.]
MRTAYKIFIRTEVNEPHGFTVYIPDFDAYTEGDSIADAIYMARDLIGLMGITMQDDGEMLPEPGATGYEASDEEIEAYVDIDFAKYRRRHDNRKVKKTLTIPSWLNEAAVSENINFSRTLEEALKNKLQI